MEAKKIIERQERLESASAGMRDYWDDVANFCLPRKGWQNTIKNIGDRLRLGSLFDATAILALQDMASGFNTNLTNSSTNWFAYAARNPELNKMREVKLWFDKVNSIIRTNLNASNWDTTLQEFYVNTGAFGTGVILTMEDLKDKVNFSEIPPNQVQIEEDARGRVNRIYRKYQLSVQQAYDEWGSKAGTVVNEKIMSKPQDKVDFIHYVGPRDRRDPAKDDSLNMPFESKWIEKSKQEVVKESGFFEFPYAVGRFYKFAGDPFGFSPAMNVLSFIKLVNAQNKTMLRAAMKVADPAYILPSRGFVVPLNLNPSALNYRDASKTTHEDLQQIPSGGNIPITLEVIQMVQEKIERGFFLPLFRALSDVTKVMTVPEVQRRIAESMGLLGPVIGRFLYEVVNPTLERVFFIHYRAGMLPDIPEIMLDQDLQVINMSPLARAQKESEIFAIESFMSDVGLVAQAKPEVLDKINGDKIVEKIAEIRNTPSEILYSDADVAQVRAQRAQQQEMMNRINMVSQGAAAVKTGSEIDKLSAETAATGTKQ